MIENELSANQGDSEFVYTLPTFNEVQKVGRLDTGLYSQKLKKEIFIIKTINLGVLRLINWDFP